jgi:branched-chain amino acid transport system permease protein
MSFEGIVIQTLSGISMGMILFIVASGLILIFSILEILNLAHGSIYMIGAYLTYQFAVKFFNNSPWGFWIALIIAPFICSIICVFIEIGLLRNIYKRALIYQFILTFGLIFIISDLVKLTWGSNYMMLGVPGYLREPFRWWSFTFPKYNILAIGAGLIIFICLFLFFQKTKIGIVMRAVTTDREMVLALGKNVPLIYTLTFMLGGFLAGLGGAVMAPMATIAPGIDGGVLVLCFVVIVVGGFGSITGSLVAALLTGLVQAWGIVFLPRMALVFPFILMVVVLIFRPWGLMGRPVEAKS